MDTIYSENAMETIKKLEGNSIMLSNMFYAGGWYIFAVNRKVYDWTVKNGKLHEFDDERMKELYEDNVVAVPIDYFLKHAMKKERDVKTLNGYIIEMCGCEMVEEELTYEDSLQILPGDYLVCDFDDYDDYKHYEYEDVFIVYGSKIKSIFAAKYRASMTKAASRLICDDYDYTKHVRVKR